MNAQAECQGLDTSNLPPLVFLLSVRISINSTHLQRFGSFVLETAIGSLKKAEGVAIQDRLSWLGQVVLQDRVETFSVAGEMNGAKKSCRESFSGST
jgi:hypothetical protein